jgi:branched-subunit amino acid transport protein
MTPMLAMLVLAAVCWFMRILFVVVIPANRLPDPVRTALQYLAPSVLAALVAVELANATSDTDPVGAAVMVGAILAAAVIARRTGSMALAIAAGATGALVVDLLLV